MNILFLSGRELSYSRNKVIFNILKQNHTVKVCTTSYKNYLLRIMTTFFKFVYYNIFFKKDLIFVGFFGQPFIPFVRVLSRKPILFDAFISAYDTLVFNRQTINEHNPIARLLFLWDKLSCQMSDIVILDTYEHINYFVKTFQLERKKFRRLLVGADESVFHPTKKKKRKNYFLVEFHGTFAPLSGVEHIIKAAKLVENNNIKFIIIGGGQTYNKCRKLADQLKLKNIIFKGWKPVYEISKYLTESDIGLGIFGNTEKAKRVIPNKACEIIAMGIPLITAESAAAKELFTDRKNVYFCKAANPKSLAKTIIEAKKNRSLNLKIGEEGQHLFRKQCSMPALKRVLQEIILEFNKN